MAEPQRKPGASQQQKEPEPLPGVVVGDEVYFRHHKGPASGRVVCHGKHGATIEMAGQQHKVKWEHVLAHKRRAAQSYQVEDEGEDGMIVVDAAGGRHFIGIPPEAREDRMVVKSMGGGRRLVFLTKAAPPGPGLMQKQIVDKNGVQTTRWVSTRPDDPPADVGHHVGFVNGEHKGHGRVMAAGQRGVTVQDSAGGVHRVEHGGVTHRWEGGGAPAGSPHQATEQAQQQAAGGKPEVKPHEGDPDTFSASSFAAQHDDPSATAESIIAGFGDGAAERVEAAKRRLGGITQTIDQHSKNGVWNDARAELHRKLIFDGIEIKGKKVPGLLHPDRIKAATPQPGEKPTFIALGGRGPGSDCVGEWLSQPWFHAIKGNHEDMLIGYHDGQVDASLYAMNGGAWAIGMTPEERQPIVDAVRDLPFAIELDTFAGIVVLIHAEVLSDNWSAWRRKLMDGNTFAEQASTWSRGQLEADTVAPVSDIRALVAGHTPTMGPPVMRGNRFFIDTGAWLKAGEVDTPFCILDAHTLTNVAAQPGVMPELDLRGFGG